MGKGQRIFREKATLLGQLPLIVGVIIVYALFHIFLVHGYEEIFAIWWIQSAYNFLHNSPALLWKITPGEYPFLFTTSWLGDTLMFSVAIFFNLLIGSAIKFLFFKERPAPQTYSNRFQKIDASSFPSIHTANGFTISFFGVALCLHMFQYTFVFNKLFRLSLGALWFLVYITVGLSRIVLKKHYPIDVLVWTILSMACIWLTLSLFLTFWGLQAQILSGGM